MSVRIAVSSLALALAIAGAARADVPAQAYGDWMGSVSVGAASLRLALHLGASSTLDSPDQNALGLPAASVSNGNHITLTVTGVGVIEADLSADGRTLSALLKQGPGYAFTLTRGTFAAPARPQTPAPPYTYVSRDVTFDNPAPGGGRLAGTLTTPTGAGPFPTVVLITGSGSQDRDETILGHKPFLVLADALTRRGVAVLRIDDRGVGGSARGGPNDTDRDFATDTLAALTWLRTQPGIDKARLGLIGHSAGGAIAPMVAQQDPGVAFMVLWAGPGVNGLEIVTEQTRQANLAAGAPPAALAANVALERELLTAVRDAPTPDAIGPAIAKIYAERGLPPLPPATITSLSSPWYRNFISYDPAPALRTLRMPVLAVIGEKDTQVTAAQNLPALRGALAGDPQATVVSLPGLNHLLQPATTGMVDEYSKIETTIDPAALKLIVDWVAKTAGL